MSFSREKDSFHSKLHSELSLQKGAFVVRYGFNKVWWTVFTRLDVVKMHLCAMAIISFEYHRQYRVMKVNNKSAIGAGGELLVSSSTREKCRVKNN